MRSPAFNILVSAPYLQREFEAYRERFAEVGLFENAPYEGIHDALAAIRGTGAALFVATSKPLVFAEKILNHFGLTGYFDRIYGSELSGQLDNKVELIRHVISSASLLPEETSMVGDRMFDILGARENNCFSIGVTYGYGPEEELRIAGADMICENPQAIAAHFLPR